MKKRSDCGHHERVRDFINSKVFFPRPESPFKQRAIILRSLDFCFVAGSFDGDSSSGDKPCLVCRAFRAFYYLNRKGVDV